MKKEPITPSVSSETGGHSANTEPRRRTPPGEERWLYFVFATIVLGILTLLAM